MASQTFARYSIIKTGSGQDFEQDYSIPFSAADYSRFKYGSKSVARSFGFELATYFLRSPVFREKVSQLQQRPGILYSSPYSFTPTATNALKDYFLHRFNSIAVNEYGILPLREGKISRSNGYVTDYGIMSHDERRQAIADDNFHMETSHLTDEVLLFLDDIRVTGSHEECMNDMLTRYGIRNDHVYLYFARTMTPKLVNPRLEHYLNTAAVRGLLDINRIIQNDKFLFNTRVVKFMLQAAPDEFETFIQYQSETFQHTLLNYATGNSYHLASDFQQNYQFLYRLLHPFPKNVLVNLGTGVNQLTTAL